MCGVRWRHEPLVLCHASAEGVSSHPSEQPQARIPHAPLPRAP
jgi:hypothetical protein